MIYLMQDEDLQGSLEYLISSLLPHENFDSSMFSANLQAIGEHIFVEELQMEYYLMYKFLSDLKSIQMASRNFKPMLTREVLDRTLETVLTDLILTPELGVAEWSDDNGHSFNIKSQEDVNAATTRLYRRTMDLYDRCFELKVDSLSALTILPILKEQILANVAVNSRRVQDQILEGIYSARVGRRWKNYTGAYGWFDYTIDMIASIRSRLEKATIGVRKINTIDQLVVIKEEWKLIYKPIAKYGIPPMDASAPILRHWMALFCGNEGTGKTAWAINIARSAIKEGARVLYMCGETTSSVMLSRYSSHEIYKSSGKFITRESLSNLDDEDEETKKEVDEALISLIESGSLQLIPKLPYKGIYDTLKAKMEEDPFDVLLIDHTGAMSGGTGNQTQDISDMSVELRDFKNDFPVYIGVMSHLSASAKKAIAEGKEIEGSPAKGSSNLSYEADEVKVMHVNKELKKLELVAMVTTKTRGNAMAGPVYLKFYGEISTFEYDLEDQGRYSAEKVRQEVMLDILDNDVTEEEDFEVSLV